MPATQRRSRRWRTASDGSPRRGGAAEKDADAGPLEGSGQKACVENCVEGGVQAVPRVRGGVRRCSASIRRFAVPHPFGGLNRLCSSLRSSKAPPEAHGRRQAAV